MDDLLGEPGRIPWGTLLVNVVGSFALAALLVTWRRSDLPGRALKSLHTSIATGLLGAFTTFSAFAVEIVDRVDTDPVVAAIYGLGSVALGLGAALAGAHLVTRRATAEVAG